MIWQRKPYAMSMLKAQSGKGNQRLFFYYKLDFAKKTNCNTLQPRNNLKAWQKADGSRFLGDLLGLEKAKIRGIFVPDGIE